MDDDRLARARDGDLDAFLEVVRSRAGRLLRLAAIASGDPAASPSIVAVALRSAWRGARGLPAATDLDRHLEARLAEALPRRLADGSQAPLGRALAGLPTAGRLALARCLDAAPDTAALAAAGRAGVELVHSGAAAETPDAGEIVDLDGPLAGWDLATLRAALVGAAGALDPDGLLEDLRRDLRAVPPEDRWRVAVRAVTRGRGTFAQGAALALATVLGIGMLAWGGPLRDVGVEPPAASDPATPGALPAGAGRSASPVDSTDQRTAAGPDADTPGDFPGEVDGHPVIGINAALRLAGDPTVTDRALAVRGWMSSVLLQGPCAAPSAAEGGSSPVTDALAPAAAFCARETVLRETPSRAGDVSAHLHPKLLPGIGLGDAAGGLAISGRERVPVVLLVHFGDRSVPACASGNARCGERVVVDRVLWVAGRYAGPATAVRPIAGDPAPRRSPADAAAIVEGAFLRVRVDAVAGVPARDLVEIEPAAAAAGRGTDFAWLVRATIDPTPGEASGSRRAWFVVDDGTGALVAAGSGAPGAGRS